MTTKISIITVTRNRKDFLPRCIESVARQDYEQKEHVIIDGLSTDGSVAVIRDYAQRYPHIRWISEKDDGISNAFNKGLAMVTGEIIGIIGDDDYYEPNILSFVADQFAQNPAIGVLSGGCHHVGNDGGIRFTLRAGFTNRLDLIRFWNNWGSTNYLAPQSTFFRKEVIEKVGGFEETDKYAMDYHHWIKITEFFAVRTVDRVLGSFRWDTGTVSFSRNKEQFREMLRISQKYWGSRLSPSYYQFACSFLSSYYWAPFITRFRNSIKYRTKLVLRRIAASLGL